MLHDLSGERVIPLKNRIVVKFIDWRYEGVIEIPDPYKPEPVEGKVVEIGPWCEHLEVGMKVVVSRFAGTYFQIKGEQYCIIEEDGVHLIDESRDGIKEEA